MSVIERTAFAIEARLLIARARRVNRMAASWRGERLCLPCRLHLCRIVTPRTIRLGAVVVGAAIDLFIAAKFGLI